MKHHRKKMIAPIVITVIIVLYYGGIAAAMVLIPEIPWIVKVLVGVFSLALTVAMVGALVSRIKEIRSGEEDDISKY